MSAADPRFQQGEARVLSCYESGHLGPGHRFLDSSSHRKWLPVWVFVTTIATSGAETFVQVP